MANIRDVKTFTDGMLFDLVADGIIADLDNDDVEEIVYEWFNSPHVGPEDYKRVFGRMRAFNHMDVHDIIEALAEATGQKWERKA